MASADRRPDVFPRGYTGDRLALNIGPLVGGTQTYASVLTGLPLRKFKVSVQATIAGIVRTLKDFNGDGNLYGIDGDFGTVDYFTGVISVTFNGTTATVTGADAGGAVTVTWATDFVIKVL